MEAVKSRGALKMKSTESVSVNQNSGKILAWPIGLNEIEIKGQKAITFIVSHLQIYSLTYELAKDEDA